MKTSQFAKPIKTLFYTLSILLFTLVAVITISIFSLDYRKPEGISQVNNSGTLVINNVNIVLVKKN